MTKARDIASAAPAPSTVSATEIGYLDGVSSAIQTQIDGKSSTSHNHNSTYVANSLVDAKGDLLVGSANDTVSRLAVASTAGYVLTVDSAEATGLKWAVAAGFNPGAWTAYTPTVTPQSGSLTSYSAASWYYQVGTIVFWTGVVKITNAGTAAGNMNVSLPFNTVTRTDVHFCGATQEFAVNGKTGYIGCGSNESSASSRDYNNGTYFVTNNQIRFSLVYEKSA